jgi:hypothetical protein
MRYPEGFGQDQVFLRTESMKDTDKLLKAPELALLEYLD